MHVCRIWKVNETRIIQIKLLPKRLTLPDWNMLRTKSLSEPVTAGNKIKINDSRIVSILIVRTSRMKIFFFFLKKIVELFSKLSSKIYRCSRFISTKLSPLSSSCRCDFFFCIAENLERELSSQRCPAMTAKQRCKFYYIFAIIFLRTRAPIQDNWYSYLSERSLKSQWVVFVQQIVYVSNKWM